MVCLWDVDSGECKATLDMHRNTVSSVAFSPDGSILAVASTNDVTLWDVRKILHQSHDNTPIHTYATNRYDVTGRRKTTLKGHTDFVSSVAFSPDGRTSPAEGKMAQFCYGILRKHHKLLGRLQSTPWVARCWW